MIEFKHILNPGPDELVIEEPVGFADLEISLKRDDKFHGMTFEASTSTLQFHGEAANFLIEQERENGVLANVTYQALSRCEGQDDFEEVLTGRLNFGRFKKSCGTDCLVSIPWEEKSCRVVLNSRFDHKVDMDSNTSFDGQIPLMDYPGLGVEVELPAKETREALECSVSESGDTPAIGTYSQLGSGDILSGIRPTYEIETYNSIRTGSPIPFNNLTFNKNDFAQPMTPQLLFDDDVRCLSGNMTMDGRIKGSVQLHLDVSNSGNINRVEVRLSRWDGEGDFFANSVIIDSSVLFNGSSKDVNVSFDESYNISNLLLSEGDGLYNYIYIQSNISGGALPAGGTTVNITFDKETFITIVAPKKCPDTSAKTYLIHETLSRAAEAISGGCIRVKSEYYGRTDSQPFSFPSDGCGGLRTVTSGLYIRRAEEPKFFVSLKDLLEGLWAIDNIGFGIEEDPNIPGNMLLRVEPVEYFYQDEEVAELDAVPDAEEDTEETKHYSKIEVGYSTWEPESINGLDEINSTREYRTKIDNLNNTLTVLSGLITGSYLIETTRQQSFAESGGADTSHDNDTFLMCLKRDGGLKVEQGNIDNPEGMYSPQTFYNYRLSPIRNLMRWYKSILPSFPGFSSVAELMFNSGTGNLSAKGMLSDPFCRQENKALSESESVYTTIFTDQNDFLPIWQNKVVSIQEYPLSIADYRKIKESPHGYVSYQCGNGDFEKGFIVEMKYKVAKGMASFTLRKKYN